MAESKRTKGPFQGSSTLDNPSILSKLINNDAMERPIGVINQSLNNFDEDDPGIFCYLLDESLKDAWDRLLRIRASFVLGNIVISKNFLRTRKDHGDA